MMLIGIGDLLYLLCLMAGAATVRCALLTELGSSPQQDYQAIDLTVLPNIPNIDTRAAPV
jgi:hypothetical protein